MTTLFISDLHLDEERPEILDLFEGFLQREGVGADALYILGDLFEAWVGDDDDSPVAARVSAALKALSPATPVYVMRGNRDFLFGRRFEERAGCSLLADPTVIELYNERVLLMHGDSLCTDDLEYQRWRRESRNPAWQREFLALPLEQRRQTAAQARAASREHTARAADTIMDVNAAAVSSAMRKHKVKRLIHGHTHRPAVHKFELSGQSARRIVLGDWYEQGSVLRVKTGKYDLAAI